MSVWDIRETDHWPPRGRPSPPFGSTRIEIIRSCPLRDIFESSAGYERQVADAARIGLAFHRVLESFVDDGLPSGHTQRLAAIQERFRRELAAQDAEKSRHPREQFLLRNEERVRMALNALYGEAQRFSGLPHAAATRRTDAPIASDVVRPSRDHPQVAEIPIHSKDGVIVGRVDLAEYTDDGPHLIDYKSAVRDDLPERYQRQLLLYAALWFEMFDEWPAKATLVYPFTGTLQDIPLTVAACRATLEEARTSIRQLQSAAPAESKATPGDVCNVCTYRPWCRPFWRFQASEQNDHVALERSRMGVQGQVKQLTTIDQHWKLLLQWRNATLKLVAPYERFPQLAGVASGATLRLLNIRLHGQRSSPQVDIYDNTEIFIVRQ